MNVEIFIISIGLGVLGFALGYAKGSEVMARHINSKLAEWMQEYKDKQL